MLKINKILSTKIKSPLSLRGTKRRSILNKGFSLIELMVAVAILAMAIFGIFLAFSTSFQGMANARDRTVATNYAQEAMEDIKNMDFLKIENTYFTTEEININGKIFTKSVHIDKIDDNLKKATSWVSWYNRNNKPLEVKNTMLIQNSAITSDTGLAVKIVLYADPYYNVLPGGGTVNLIAVLKDQNGNVLTKWDNTEDVSFSIIASIDLTGQTVQNLGSISPTVVTLNQGSASTVFTSSNENLLGYVTIQALVVLPDEGQLTDTVTLKITDSGVAIDLVANPQTILINVGTSNITATIVDSEGIKVPNAKNLVTFNIDDPSLGTLEGPNPVNAFEGEANITLRSTELPGKVTVSASATDLQTETVEVTISEISIVPTSISITANPSSIYIDNPSTITVTIKDQYGNPVGFTGSVDLYLNDNIYPFSNLNFSDESSKITYFTPTSAGQMKIEASCVLPDIGTVTDSIIVNVYNKPTKIVLTASPESIKADGSSYSQIKATLVNSEGIKVPIADNSITFSIDSEVSGFLEGTNPVKAVNGEANIILKSTELPGTVTITASAIDVDSGTVDVIITGVPKYISMSVNPTTVALPNETAIITVNVLDINENPVEFTGEIGLVITGTGSGTLSSYSITFNNQTSVSTNFYPTDAGIVRIKAWKISGDGDIFGEFYSPEITIIIPGIFVLYKDIEDNDYLEKYDYDGNHKYSWDPANIIYGKFCVDKSNNLYIINGNYIQKKSNIGEPILTSNEIATNNYTINIGPNDYIYFTQNMGTDVSPNYFIKKINTTTLEIEATLNLTIGILYYGFAIDSSGNIFLHNYTSKTIEKWNFIEGFTGISIGLSSNYVFSELAIAGEYIGGVGVEVLENARKAFILPNDFSSAETEFTSLSENLIPFYISSIGEDFLFSGLNGSNQVVFGRYGTDGSLKWNQTITIIDDYPYSDCIIGAYPF